MADRVTRILQELLAEGAPEARVTRIVQELIAEGAPVAYVTRVFQEVFGAGAPVARVSRIFQEIFADNPALQIAHQDPAEMSDFGDESTEDSWSGDGEMNIQFPVAALAGERRRNQMILPN